MSIIYYSKCIIAGGVCWEIVLFICIDHEQKFLSYCLYKEVDIEIVLKLVFYIYTILKLMVSLCHYIFSHWNKQIKLLNLMR